MAMGLRGGMGMPRSERARGRRVDAATLPGENKKTPKKKLEAAAVWREARELIWARRGRISLGLALMLVNRISGLVLPE